MRFPFDGLAAGLLIGTAVLYAGISAIRSRCNTAPAWWNSGKCRSSGY